MENKEKNVGGEGGAEWEMLAQMPEFKESTLETTPMNDVDVERPGAAILRNMGEHWGDLGATEGVFGPNTTMHPIEYQTIAENMSWEEFAAFSDVAYELGHKSEDEYRKMLLHKGSDLQRQGLFDWRSLALAVRRYNVAKHLPEIGEGKNFYFSTNFNNFVRPLRSGHMMGYAMNSGNEGNLRSQGLDTELLHLSYDVDGDDGLELGMDRERAQSSDMITIVFDSGIVQDDSFDLATRYPTLREVELNPGTQVLVAKDRSIYNKVLREQRDEERGNVATMPLMTQAEWYREHGRQIVDNSEQQSAVGKLIDDAIMKVNKAEVKEFIGSFLSEVDSNKLEEIVQEHKHDYKAAAEMAVEYFAQILGVEALRLDFSKEKSDTLGRHMAVGTIVLNEHVTRKKPLQLVNVVAHEMFHEWQRQLQRKYERGELSNNPKLARRAELYGFCQDNYDTTFASDWAYRRQLLEKEAFEFGDGAEKILKRKRSLNRRERLKNWLKRP